MTYVTKDKRRVVIEVFTFVDEIRKRLMDAGYVFDESDVYVNQFWGTRFTIIKPTGKGAQAKLNFLFDGVTR